MNNNVFSEIFYLEHERGDKLYPVKVRNRDTGRVAFRVSPGGAGGNRKDMGQEVDSELKVRELVINQGYAVRASTKNRSRNGLYKFTMRSIKSVVSD